MLNSLLSNMLRSLEHCTGVTLGTPIAVLVPNTDQRGGVSFSINPLKKQMLEMLSLIIFMCFRITKRCPLRTDHHMRMPPMTSNTEFELFRYCMASS